MDEQAQLIKWCNSNFVKTYSKVPATRPETFITVELLGGSQSINIRRPEYAFQCWAKTDSAAHKLAQSVADGLFGITELEGFASAGINNLYPHEDPTGEHERYQVTATFTIN